jgi:hypothetical protein
VTGPQASTGEQPAVEPTVRTAPTAEQQPRRWWAAIPRHLGRARTSTVVLALLFVVIGVLYLEVRPDPGLATGGEDAVVEEAPGAPAPTAPPATTPPPEEPVPTEEPSTTSVPEETSPPEESTGTAPPSSEEPSGTGTEGTTPLPEPTTELPAEPTTPSG